VIRGSQLGQRHLGIGARPVEPARDPSPATAHRIPGDLDIHAPHPSRITTIPPAPAVGDGGGGAPGDDPRPVWPRVGLAGAVYSSALWLPDDDAPLGDAEVQESCSYLTRHLLRVEGFQAGAIPTPGCWVA